MLTFREYLTEDKNVHMEHLEDSILNLGVDGTRSAINFLRSLRDMLAGRSKKSVNVTVKWDGCVHETTIISTNLGDMTIREIYESSHLHEILLIKGFDFDTNEVVMTPLFGTSAENGSKQWVEVITEEGSIILTEDHEIHTSNRGWVAAKDLKENDDITEL
jgi:hypothetical protein